VNKPTCFHKDVAGRRPSAAGFFWKITAGGGNSMGAHAAIDSVAIWRIIRDSGLEGQRILFEGELLTARSRGFGFQTRRWWATRRKGTSTRLAIKRGRGICKVSGDRAVVAGSFVRAEGRVLPRSA
jgi:hypothetical protein